MINEKILNWLCHTPASDQNFKRELKEANVETIQEAIKFVSKKDLQLTKEKKLHAELNRKLKNNEQKN